MDPDPTGLYMKKKRQRSELNKDISQSQGEKTTSSVDYPTEGWSTSLSKLPVFTRAEMNKHIARTGKNIGNKDHHSVPTTLRKAKTFLEDEYLLEIMAASDQQHFYFKAKCYQLLVLLIILNLLYALSKEMFYIQAAPVLLE